MSKKFRRCAGAIVFNSKGLVLLGNRNDTANDAWQFPQGGIEKEETVEEAAKRELFEETGILSVRTISIDKTPKRYVFPLNVKEKLRQLHINNDGQEIYFVLFYFYGKDEEINISTKHPEFNKYKWDSFDFAVQQIVDFKKEIYVSALNRFYPLIEQYINQLS